MPAVEHYVCCFGGLHDLCRHRFACIQTAARAAAVESDFTRGLYPNYLVGDSKVHNTLFRGCIYLGCCPGPESCRHACSRLQGTYIVWLQCFTALLAQTTFAMVYIPKTAQPPLSRYQASNHLEQSLQASHSPTCSLQPSAAEPAVATGTAPQVPAQCFAHLPNWRHAIISGSENGKL